jgi:hypothetical protein
MADQFIGVPPDDTGKKVATFEKTESGVPVQVQKVSQAGRQPDDDVQPMTTAPIGTEWAAPVRNIPSGTQAVSAAALPLPAGAGSETGQERQTELLEAILRELKALRLGFARDVRDMPDDEEVDGIRTQ